eukprot:SAG11_NODE_638_length_8025_cov_14.591093_7_plen_61_part_00
MSFRSFAGHDFIHLYIQIRWGTLELVEEETMWTEDINSKTVLQSDDNYPRVVSMHHCGHL